MPVKHGFPRGVPELARDQIYYNQLFQEDTERDGRYVWSWHRQSSRVVTFYPALVLAKPPIIDIGCGCGQLAEMCADFGVAYAGGVDFSKRAIAIAKTLAPQTQFVLADIRDYNNYSAHNYETAVMLEVLEHIYEDRELIERIPTGKTVVGSVPNFHTEGHCRWFGTPEGAKRRYSDLLRIDRVITEQSGGANKWFIFRGVRK